MDKEHSVQSRPDKSQHLAQTSGQKPGFTEPTSIFDQLTLIFALSGNFWNSVIDSARSTRHAQWHAVEEQQNTVPSHREQLHGAIQAARPEYSISTERKADHSK
jgi:hypothetical protein